MSRERERERETQAVRQWRRRRKSGKSAGFLERVCNAQDEKKERNEEVISAKQKAGLSFEVSKEEQRVVSSQTECVCRSDLRLLLSDWFLFLLYLSCSFLIYGRSQKEAVIGQMSQRNTLERMS